MTAQPNAVPPIPEGSSTVMPWIISRDTAKLLEFLKQAFGAQELTLYWLLGLTVPKQAGKELCGKPCP